jgi:hypothetical protein
MPLAQKKKLKLHKSTAHDSFSLGPRLRCAAIRLWPYSRTAAARLKHAPLNASVKLCSTRALRSQKESLVREYESAAIDRAQGDSALHSQIGPPEEREGSLGMVLVPAFCCRLQHEHVSLFRIPIPGQNMMLCGGRLLEEHLQQQQTWESNPIHPIQSCKCSSKIAQTLTGASRASRNFPASFRGRSSASCFPKSKQDFTQW